MLGMSRYAHQCIWQQCICRLVTTVPMTLHAVGSTSEFSQKTTWMETWSQPFTILGAEVVIHNHISRRTPSVVKEHCKHFCPSSVGLPKVLSPPLSSEICVVTCWNPEYDPATVSSSHLQSHTHDADWGEKCSKPLHFCSPLSFCSGLLTSHLQLICIWGLFLVFGKLKLLHPHVNNLLL